MNRRLLIPLAVFAVIVAFLFVGLGLNPREVPSPLIGKPAPVFSLARLKDPAIQAGSAEMAGKVWVLNVWASWCVPCRQEHPLLVDLARSGVVPLVGLNYKDKTADAERFLAQLGDPYVFSVTDHDGRVGIDFGVYGVPETFVIDKAGVIRFKHIGPLTPEVMQSRIVPLVRELERS